MNTSHLLRPRHLFSFPHQQPSFLKYLRSASIQLFSSLVNHFLFTLFFLAGRDRGFALHVAYKAASTTQVFHYLSYQLFRTPSSEISTIGVSAHLRRSSSYRYISKETNLVPRRSMILSSSISRSFPHLWTSIYFSCQTFSGRFSLSLIP